MCARRNRFRRSDVGSRRVLVARSGSRRMSALAPLWGAKRTRFGHLPAFNARRIAISASIRMPPRSAVSMRQRIAVCHWSRSASFGGNFAMYSPASRKVTSVRLPALIGSSNSRLQPVALNAPNRFRCRSQAGIAEDHRYYKWDAVPQRHRSRMHPRPPMVCPDGPRKPTYSRRSASRSFELVAWPNDMRRRATECRNSQLYQSRQ